MNLDIKEEEDTGKYTGEKKDEAVEDFLHAVYYLEHAIHRAKFEYRYFHRERVDFSKAVRMLDEKVG